MVQNKNGNEMGAPDPQVKVSGAVGVASAPTDKSMEALFEEWGEFLEKLKDSRDLPIVALVKALKFYRDHVDADVFIDFAPLDRRIFAYRIRNNEMVKEISFYTVDGLEFGFRQRAYYSFKHKVYGNLGFSIDHLARSEVIE